MTEDLRREMVALLGRIVGGQPLPPDLQRTSLGMFAALVPPGAAGGAPAAGAAPVVAAALPPAAATAAVVGNRRIVYVHGICRHSQGFSDSWWNSLYLFVPTAFGTGQLGQTRLEVIWSDLVNQASANLAAAAAMAGVAGMAAGIPPAALTAQAARERAAAEIKEALQDRADQHVQHTAALAAGPLGAGPLGARALAGASPAAAPQAAADTSNLVSIPGLNCIDDFSIYLTDDGVRQQIVDRFIAVVRPELQAGRELDVIGHSWGTVVAYEGLRQLEDEGVSPRLIRNFFTVGAALSIGPVKMRLRPANRSGKKPASVRRWINLDAYGDLVGGQLKNRPYAVDLDFLNLDAFGCSSFLGLVNPQCAHSSYFASGNVAVNQGIFGRYVDLA